MMRNGGLADGEAIGNLAGGEFARLKAFEDGAAGGVVQGFEELVHGIISIFR